MEETKKLLPYLFIILLDFYFLPLLIKDTGTAMLLLLVVMPLICFVCSFIYGLKHSYRLFYALIVTALFVPSIYVFYNSSAWVYALGYGIIALVGNLSGAMLFPKKNKHIKG
ncbi:MAG: hypothetical protein VB035_07465 [Candidatus Fimivivens sp.]|nr:hypothetical protein [Candidatus Fimivivens sp.]